MGILARYNNDFKSYVKHTFNKSAIKTLFYYILNN